MKRPGGFDRGGEGVPGAEVTGREPDGRGADESSHPTRSHEPRPTRVIAFPSWRVKPVATAAEDMAAEEDSAPAEPEADTAVVQPLESPGLVHRVDEADPVRAAKRRLKLASRSRRSQESRDQRRFTAHARRRRRYWAVAGLAVLALALFVAVGIFTPLTAVKEIEIVGITRVNEQDMRAALTRFEGVPLALVGEQEVHRALEPFPLIQRYSVERIPPHTLVVRIEERDPVIALERDGQLGLVDPAGVLVATSPERPEGVPLASGTVIDTASPAFQAAATVIRDMPADLRSQLATVTASSPQDVEFALTSGTRVLWGEADQTQRKSVVLRAMLASVGQVSLIDVASPDTPVFR